MLRHPTVLVAHHVSLDALVQGEAGKVPGTCIE